MSVSFLVLVAIVDDFLADTAANLSGPLFRQLLLALAPRFEPYDEVGITLCSQLACVSRYSKSDIGFGFVANIAIENYGAALLLAGYEPGYSLQDNGRAWQLSYKKLDQPNTVEFLL